MGNLDGQILFALISALILAWIGGLFVARWYSSRLLSFMQTGGAPVDESAIDRSETFLAQVESKQPTSSLLMIWLFGQQLPPQVFIFILTSPGIRSVGPYLLFVFLFFVTSDDILSQSVS